MQIDNLPAVLDFVRMIAAPLLLGWILAETLHDFRDQDIPLFYSIVPLSIGLVVMGLSGAWVTALIVGLLVAATNLNSTLRFLAIVVGMVVATANVPPEFFPLLAGFLIVFLLFHLNIMGGADALAAIYLLVWFPYWLLLCLLFAGMVVAAAGMLVAKFRNRAWLQISSTVTGQSSGTRMPSLIGFAIGSLVFFSYQFGPVILSTARHIIIR